MDPYAAVITVDDFLHLLNLALMMLKAAADWDTSLIVLIAAIGFRPFLKQHLLIIVT